MTKRLCQLLAVAGLLAPLLSLLATATAARAAVESAGPGQVRVGLPLPAPGLQPQTNGLSYQGGPVMAQRQNLYAIYWGTSYSPTYQNVLGTFFADVSADSGKTSNVFYNATQYYSTLGGWTFFAAYSQQLAATWTDPFLPPSGCTNTTLGSLRCYTDAQVRDEVSHAIQQNGWPTGPSTVFLVFLGAGISTCSGLDCAGNEFCAYHVHYDYNGQTLRYANMPYFSTDPWAECASGQAPSGDVVADRTVNLLSRVESDIVTDPLGTGWVYPSIHPKEVGDLCFQQFGQPLGDQPGNYYNQVINGHHYWLQEERSNWSNSCVRTGW